MSNPSHEALLISALLHNQDVTEATRYGVTEDHFRGYAEQYHWLISYYHQYGTSPTVDTFLSVYPDFPIRDHRDVRYAADMVISAFMAHKFLENTAKGVAAIRQGMVSDAYDLMAGTTFAATSAAPLSVNDASFLDSWDTPLRGIEVPYPTLQRHTGGLRDGNLWILAARLGQGKSAYLLDMATHAMCSGKRVLFFSLEMTDHELRSRHHSMLARKLGHRDFTTTELLRRDVDRMSYKKLLGEIAERYPDGALHVHTPADGPVSPAVVASRAQEYELVVADYVTLMTTDAGEHASSDWRTATQISNRLKQVALSTGVPILVAAQVNRDGDQGDLPPKIRNLAQADALGQDADVVITMRARARNVASIFSLEKNRHGRSGLRWWTTFDVDRGVFTEITEDAAEDLVIQQELLEIA